MIGAGNIAQQKTYKKLIRKMPIDPDAANWKYKIVNYDLEATDESSLLASQNDMEKGLNEWGEGGWQLVCLVHVLNMGNLMRLMATRMKIRLMSFLSV
jgi:hypothetical protein